MTTYPSFPKNTQEFPTISLRYAYTGTENTLLTKRQYAISFDSDRAECRNLVRLGWNRYQISDAFARLFEWQYAGRTDASLTEAALYVTENPNEIAAALDRRPK